MDKDARVLSNLIENLEDIKGKLSSIDFDREWIDCILPKRESRSSINTKKILESLVMKTVEGKGYDEDIASICNQHKPFLEKHLQFQNLFSSDEFLTEAKNLPKTPLKFEFLHSSLTTFQDFLGDILHSICQISSCQLKLPSKILVKDLLKLKNQYLSIWDLISSVFEENKCHKHSDSSLMGESKGIKSQVDEIHKRLQMSLKEMSRVKLEIEHYFKCNLIEMQFTKSPYNTDSGESVNSKEKVLESNTQSEYSLLKMINSTSQDLTSNEINACSFSSRKQLNNVALSSPSLIFSEAQLEKKENNDNDGNIHSYTTKTETWNDILNDSFVEKPCRDFFYQPISLPPTYLFVDPTTVLIHSKNGVRNRNSLPKIYSVDSLNEKSIVKEPTKSTHFPNKKISTNEFNKEINHSVEVEKVEEMPSTKNIEEEDLFNENTTKCENQTDSYSICLQEKLSSLFGMLRTAETIHEKEDIFEETPLKIERSDFSFSETLQNHRNLKFNTNKEHFASNVSSLGKLRDIFKETQTKIESSDFSYSQTLQNYKNLKCNTSKENTDSSVSSTTTENPPDNHNTNKNNIPFGEENHENICTIKGKVKPQIPFHFGGLKEHYNNDKSISQKEAVIYDKQSLIELYHTREEATQGLNSGSTPGEHSTFSLWPVTAEYIQVSKSKRPQKCQSVSSDNSIPLSKSFGKSFYSLHLNKRYEQKQLYDGDLLVLEHPEESVEPESSRCSLLNESYSTFNQEENYKSHEKTNNNQNMLGDQFNRQMLLLQKENLSNLKVQRDLKSKRKNLKDVKKTLAVHYKDYGDSFKASGKNFDFLNVNGFDVNNNWNSFISIFTSKVGQTAQINHHRMFSKVINTFTTDSVTCNNVFGNVHTLTSNGGPFRLFDINGYPLTDSTGNVLKDPYGKSVVTLDSTGFPKDNIKVFDAAGNSPNDINFDPTQKPKTNSIIIKLTDNFKRPLHLYDKYGRPLTDSCGKLLVNIHGRPLLRFDNFGRPNTDYRGGPLYTDNGYRWSYKTGDSLSSSQLSNESLMPKKLCGFLETESRQNSYENFCLKDKIGDKSRSTNAIVEPKTTDYEKCPILNTSKSDIWNKVENVLQQFPKSKKVDPTTSQTSVIVNNVIITQNPIEKECLKTIIYHDNIIQQDLNNFSRIHSQPFTNHKTHLDFQNINNGLIDMRLTEKGGTYCVGKIVDTDKCGPYSTAPLPFPNKIFAESACSKCLNFENKKHTPSNKYLNERSCNLGKALTCDTGDLLKNPIVPTLTSFSKTYIQNKESYSTLKNNDYLNSLCNRILKHEINYSDKTKHAMNRGIFKKHNDWTDTSNTEFLSSIGSKYTTGFTTQTESPNYFSDTSKNQSQTLQISNKYYNSYLKHQQHLDYYKKELDVLNKDRYCGEYYQIQSQKDIECVRKKSQYSSHEQTQEPLKNKSTLSLPKPNDCKTSINIVNKGNKHYEIKVTEMLGKMINPKLNFGLFGTAKSNNEKSNSLHTSQKREIETSTKNKHYTKKSTSKLLEEKCNITETYKEKINHSLFRFCSDEIVESTPKPERNIKAKYPQKAIYPLNSNVCKDSFKVYHHEENDQTNKTLTHDKVCHSENYYNGHSIKPSTQFEQCSNETPSNKKECLSKNNNVNRKQTYSVKKPVSSNRECNLASFFGSPVKYVLNKLDGNRSVKPTKVSRSGKKKMFSNSKENVKSSYDATYPNNKIKPQSEIQIKTLYDITKSSKKRMLSSNEKNEIRNHKDKLFLNEQGTLLAFRSKSCAGLVCQDEEVLMSYSGDSQRVNHKKLSQGYHLSSTKLHKSMSATSYITEDGSRRKDSTRRSTKYEHGKETPKNGPNSLNSNAPRRKYTKLSYGTQKSSKTRKGSSGRNSKSPLLSSRTKAKEISLFRKVEPEGKYMLKIKR